MQTGNARELQTSEGQTTNNRVIIKLPKNGKGLNFVATYDSVQSGVVPLIIKPEEDPGTGYRGKGVPLSFAGDYTLIVKWVDHYTLEFVLTNRQGNPSGNFHGDCTIGIGG